MKHKRLICVQIITDVKVYISCYINNCGNSRANTCNQALTSGRGVFIRDIVKVLFFRVKDIELYLFYFHFHLFSYLKLRVRVSITLYITVTNYHIVTEEHKRFQNDDIIVRHGSHWGGSPQNGLGDK